MGSTSGRRDRVDDRSAGPDSPDAEPDPESVARSIVLQKLAAAPQTRAQLDAAMARKDVPAEVRAHVLERFTDVGLIDDVAFAQAWVGSRHNGRGLAKRAIGHELRQRGIDSRIVDEAVEALPAEQEEQTARALVARRLASTRRLDPAVRTRRLAAMLARKGYSAGLSYRVVREALACDGVDENDLPAVVHED